MALTLAPRNGACRSGFLLAALLLCLAGGTLSFWLGQDANWDLRNYHLYAPWSYLGDRRAVDLAPAQMQSYFNPWIDLPYHWLLQHGGARCATFMLGAWHTLALLALFVLARQSLSRGAAVLATVGAALGPIFLYQFGSTVGDDTGAVLVMTAVCCMSSALPLLQEAHLQRRTLVIVLAAGIAVGAAAGLKLTNGPMALALCAMPLAAAAPIARRAVGVAVAGVGVVVGVLSTGGHWYLAMWSDYGNPLFPQFNTVFRSPWAPPVGIVDHAWGPVDLGQRLLWPFLFTLRPHLLGEIPMVSLLLPVTYTALGIGTMVGLHRFIRGRRGHDVRTEALCFFVAISYLSWQFVFGIGRYLVVVEMLCPLLLLLLWRSWLGATRKTTLVVVVIVTAGALSVVNLKSWGKTGFAAQDFAVELPVLPAPQRSAIVFVGRDPQAWMATQYPAQVAFGAIASNIPESPASRQRILDWLAARDHVLAVFPLPMDLAGNAAVPRRDMSTVALFGPTVEAVARMDVLATETRCRRAASWIGRLFYKGVLQSSVSAGVDGQPQCRMFLPPAAAPIDFDEGARRAQEEAQASLAMHGRQMEPSQCSDHNARIGDANFPYRACLVRSLP